MLLLKWTCLQLITVWIVCGESSIIIRIERPPQPMDVGPFLLSRGLWGSPYFNARP